MATNPVVGLLGTWTQLFVVLLHAALFTRNQEVLRLSWCESQDLYWNHPSLVKALRYSALIIPANA